MPDRYIGELRVLERLNEYEFEFEADILRTGPVQGGRWEFARLEENYRSFAGRPVLIAYIGNRVGDGHNASERIDPESGERYRSFTGATAERIIGMISENLDDLSLEERDGYTWLRVKGRIWTYYAKEAVEEIVRTGRMDVSIEAEVHDMREEDGREVYDSWIGLGLTILGAGVDPAVPGANIRALADMEEEFNDMKLRVASLVKEVRNSAEDEEEEDKPQNNPTKEKELKHRMRLSKKQLCDIQAKFADYTVLAAEQGDNGVTVCLMNATGQTAVYQMASIDETVVPERIVPVNAQVQFCADGEEAVCVDACDLVETMTKACNDAENRAECAERELASAKETIKQMEAVESARRLSAAKKTAADTLNAFNANREDKVSEDAIRELSAEIETGKFTACEDENHAWNGDKMVEEKVLSICAAAVMEMDKANAKSAKNAYIWEKFASGDADDGSVEALLARKGIKA